MANIEIKFDRRAVLEAALVILLILGGLGWFFDHRSLNQQLSQQIENAAGKDIIIKQWKDTANREHSLAEARQVTLKELKKSQDSSIVALRKEIDNVKNLVSRIKISTTTAGTVQVVVKDTMFAKISRILPVNWYRQRLLVLRINGFR